MNIFVETNWINKEMHKGTDKHYRSLEQACKSVDGVEFIGFFKPLNEAWNWTHFMKVDRLEKWRTVDKEVHRLYPELDDNVSSSMSRIYHGVTATRLLPLKDLENMKILVMDLNNCIELERGIQEYYAQNCQQFEAREGAELLGLYQTFSESWNWAIVKLYDSMSRYEDLVTEFLRTFRRIPEIINGMDRIYEKFEP